MNWSVVEPAKYYVKNYYCFRLCQQFDLFIIHAGVRNGHAHVFHFLEK